MKRRCVSVFMVLFTLCGPMMRLWPMDISQGRMKLSLNEGTGRFIVSYMTDLKNGSYKPLLVYNDPRTTIISIAIGNKVYRLGESAEFSLKTERTETGGKFLWTSTLVSVTEEFSFIASQGSTLADGVRMDLTFKNVSAQDLNVGARIIFDTYLGEASYVHFKTDKIAEITRELTIQKTEKAAYWISPLVGDPDQFGLTCPLTADAVTQPDRVVFANWKRLTDVSWGYETAASRNFNLMPYSVNDSAVCHYYDARPLQKDSGWRITTILGKSSASGYAVASSPSGSAPTVADTLSTLKDAVKGGAEVKDALLAAETDLAAIDRLITYINTKLSSADSLSQEELASLSQLVAELQDRRTKLATDSGK